MFDTIKGLGLEAFGQLAAGFGLMVANWVLYGDQAGNSMRKMVAQIFFQLAMVATQYAIMCLAAAAFASTGFGAILLGGSPHQFLIAAAIFSALAIGSAVTGRLIAGDSFKQQNTGQAAFNQQTSRAIGQSSGNGGQIYSKFGDDPTIENIGANTPFGSTSAQENFFSRLKESMKAEITLRLDKDGVLDAFESSVNKNGRMRNLIINVASS